ncbi:hypothetical protein T492DRAFT_834487 [Pavlovales sp. CCMP2436]|nr:hypothetical protein T492DRAFT_834487 [Pavlovales sp. CCMP2436]
MNYEKAQRAELAIAARDEGDLERAAKLVRKARECSEKRSNATSSTTGTSNDQRHAPDALPVDGPGLGWQQDGFGHAIVLVSKVRTDEEEEKARAEEKAAELRKASFLRACKERARERESKAAEAEKKANCAQSNTQLEWATLEAQEATLRAQLESAQAASVYAAAAEVAAGLAATAACFERMRTQAELESALAALAANEELQGQVLSRWLRKRLRRRRPGRRRRRRWPRPRARRRRQMRPSSTKCSPTATIRIELKTAREKLLLRVSSDRNSSPHAEEASKIVQAAFLAGSHSGVDVNCFFCNGSLLVSVWQQCPYAEQCYDCQKEIFVHYSTAAAAYRFALRLNAAVASSFL